MSKLAIVFKEGAEHSVTINVAPEVPLTNMEAVIQVKCDVGQETAVLEFSTIAGSLNINAQQMFFQVPGEDSIGISGNYKWQLMLYADPTKSDAIKFPIYDFIIQPSLVF